LLSAWFDAHSWMTYLLDVGLVAGICGLGWWTAQRRIVARK
jgi:hypothetical protein